MGHPVRPCVFNFEHFRHPSATSITCMHTRHPSMSPPNPPATSSISRPHAHTPHLTPFSTSDPGDYPERRRFHGFQRQNTPGRADQRITYARNSDEGWAVRAGQRSPDVAESEAGKANEAARLHLRSL